MFLSSSADGYEIMVWLAALGGSGRRESHLLDWKVHRRQLAGENGNMQVYSFVASSSTNSLSGGLTEFSQYLAQKQGLKSNCI